MMIDDICSCESVLDRLETKHLGRLGWISWFQLLEGMLYCPKWSSQTVRVRKKSLEASNRNLELPCLI